MANILTVQDIQDKLDANLPTAKLIRICDDRIVIIEYKGDLYKQYPSNISRGKTPSIKSAIDKNAVFITKAREIHGNKYIYDKVDYVKAKSKVEIVCPVHGLFTQTPNEHFAGSGCTECANAKKSNTWSYSDWEKAGNTSKNFEGFKLYIIECWDDEEQFFKIGKTYRDIEYRFSGKSMPYEWRTINTITGDARYISELEDKLHQLHKNVKYVPRIKFGGMYECFSEIKGGM